MFKLLAAAALLLLAAAYIGKRDTATTEIAAAPTPVGKSASRIVAGPVILKPQGGPAQPVTVGNASLIVSADGREARVEGDIGANFARDLAQALQAHRFLQRIVITSGGGYAGAGLEAAQLIQRHNLTVRVKSHCASMCVALWAAAAAREMEPDAVIGLHQWRAPCASLAEAQRKECEYQSQFWTAHDASYDGWLRGAGFSERLLKLQESTPVDHMALLTAPQLWNEGVDFSVVDAAGNRMDRQAAIDFLQSRRNKR